MSQRALSAIDTAKAWGAEALNFLATPLFSVPGSRNNQTVIERTAATRLPSIFQWPETAETGAILGYGPRFTDIYRQRARIVVKVLRGAKPTDIPVEQPTDSSRWSILKPLRRLVMRSPRALYCAPTR